MKELTLYDLYDLTKEFKQDWYSSVERILDRYLHGEDRTDYGYLYVCIDTGVYLTPDMEDVWHLAGKLSVFGLEDNLAEFHRVMGL